MNEEKKYNVIIVFHSPNLQSGATRSLMDIVDYLIQTGRYTIYAVFPDEGGSAAEHLKNEGIETYHYHYGDLMQNLRQPLLKRILKFPFLCIRMLRVGKQAECAAKTFAKDQIDMVYSNTSSIIFGGWLGELLKCRQVWHIREFRKLDHRMQFFLGDTFLQKFIDKRADAVFFVSKSVRDMHTKYIDPKKMYVTYNSYPKEFIHPKKEFNHTKGLHVLIAGDIKPGKGQLDCIKAILMLHEKYPDHNYILHLAGRESDEKYFHEVECLANDVRIRDQIILHGQVSDMVSLRERMDVGIVASENEAFGRTAIEGMLSMMAMIGRNSGGTREQIKDHVTGLLYDGSVENLAGSLEYYYNNRADMEQIAKHGFEESVRLYTNGHSAKIVDRVIRNVLRDGAEKRE